MVSSGRVHCQGFACVHVAGELLQYSDLPSIWGALLAWLRLFWNEDSRSGVNAFIYLCL